MVSDAMHDESFSQSYYGNQSYLTLVSPGTGAKHYIEGSVRNPKYSELVKNVSQWSKDKTNRFYDILSDFMALNNDINNYESVLENLSDKLIGLSGEFADMAAIRDIFTKLDSNHKIHIMYESVANLKTNLTKVLDTNYELSLKYRKDPEISQKIHMEGLYLQFILEFCKIAIKYGIRAKSINYESSSTSNKNWTKFSKYHGLTSLFLLRFIAYSKNKLSAEDLLNDISEYSNLLSFGSDSGDEIFEL
ncbi:hypothetical protein MMKA1_04850 [Methanococcus maripaludis KA1]|jgi:hypothetical protein|uniref:Uncharacterized protein n=1 Tax=Methanococcus maripaludis KA1 TaxID=637914 RepID=A0A2Z5PCW4_METMI|nr:hypothetical protein [Methanococcus maripaludis]BAP60602.1 hypothetical protein MMKA1_04850 [Methanococcus maripaludis KA1]